MLEQMQTKDSKSIWKLQYKGSLLVEYAIILGLAAIFLVFNGFFDPIGDKAEKNAKAVNKDAYVYGGVPKGSVTQTPDGTTAPPHSSNGQIIGTSSGSGSPGDNIETNIQFTFDKDNKKENTGVLWSTDTSEEKIRKYSPTNEGNTKFFSLDELLSFGSDDKGTYRIFFNKDEKKQTTNKVNGEVYLPVENNDKNDKNDKKDFGSLQIQVITYKYYKYDEQNKLISEVLNGGFFPIDDIVLTIDKPCYVAFNFKVEQDVIKGINSERMEIFISQYMKIVKL